MESWHINIYNPLSRKAKALLSPIMDTTKNQLESLQQVLTYDHVPLCSGAISPPPEGFHLYYGRQNSKLV